VANAGDSTGVLYGKSSSGDFSNEERFHLSLVNRVVDAALIMTSDPVLTHTPSPDAISNYLILTGDHSPENLSEFYRLRDYRRPQQANTEHLPALIMAYDAPNIEKVLCPPIYEFNDDKTQIEVTGKGK